MESGISPWKAVHRVYIFQEYLVPSHYERLCYIKEKLKTIALRSNVYKVKSAWVDTLQNHLKVYVFDRLN